MSDSIIINDTNDLKKIFQNTKKEYAPYIFLPITEEGGLANEERLSRLIQGYKKSGYGGVIPFVPAESTVRPFSEEYYRIYDCIAEEADTHGLQLGYLDDIYLMKEYLKETPEAVCSVLSRYETACASGSSIRLPIKEGDLLSIAATNDDDARILSLLDYVKDGMLVWTVPEGNWTVEQYVCEKDASSGYIDLMDYETSLLYLKQTLKPLLDRLEAQRRKGISLYIYKNINYCGQNRRLWHSSFHQLFESAYGFSPAPYYPLMFRDFGGNAKRYKSMIMELRSRLFNDGFLKAAADYCKTKNIFCTGYPEESKSVACSWLFGDGQLYHRYASAPGVAMSFAYLYGLNGIKVASGAADVFGCPVVAADIFKHYQVLRQDIIYREAMNTFVRGVNMIFAHLGEDRQKDPSDFNETESASSIWGSIFSKGDDLADFADFTARVQAMLRGGEHISEVAIIYPIHSIHAMSYLYQAAVHGFEYPSTPENEDYMELMNNFLNYVGIDATFIHPDAIAERGLSENGTLFLENGDYMMKMKILVLPSMSVVSLRVLRKLKQFFDEGGKIIATDNLPTIAYEFTDTDWDVNDAIKRPTKEDKEAGELLDYIFGPDCRNNKIYRMYCMNTNENGGIAYFFPPNKTSVDGTDSVSANILYQAVSKFGFAPDVYMDRMPRREFSGIVNYHLPAFLKVGVDSRLSRGCSMNYLHKRMANTEIYYITNTTGNDYEGNILLRGRLQPEEWNPYNGKIKKLAYEYVRFRGEVYTKVNEWLEASSCTFIVSSNIRTQKEIVKDLTVQGALEPLKEYFPKENF